MPDRSEQLSLCLVCSHPLADAEARCGRCGGDPIRDADLIDLSERQRYKQHLAERRAAWTALEIAVRESLREFGEGWGRGERWDQFWGRVREQAGHAGLGEYNTQSVASDIWKELERADKEATAAPPPEPNEVPDEVSEDRPLAATLGRIRDWVSGLTDGEVNASDWVDFVKSLTGPRDPELLKTLRDQEIDRQFAAFQTARVDAAGNITTGRRARVKQFIEKLGGGSELSMLIVRGGEFRMGSDRYGYERPTRLVRVADFYLGRFQVTQSQWRNVARLSQIAVELSEDDSAFSGDELPVECVNWPEAVEFCARLAHVTGRPYRLPSEAEWEYACRAGSTTAFAFGDTVTPELVNYNAAFPYGGAARGVARGRTVPVGSLGVANDFGFYDMHGNVAEWCADEWHDNYEGGPADGSAWGDGTASPLRVTRGGAWVNTAEVCRSSDRGRESMHLGVKHHYLGLRVALSSL